MQWDLTGCRLGLAALCTLAIGCTVQPGDVRQPQAGVAPIVVDPVSGDIGLDTDSVPYVAGGCASGELMVRNATDDGWECATGGAGGGVTSVTAGEGLLASGTTDVMLSVDFDPTNGVATTAARSDHAHDFSEITGSPVFTDLTVTGNLTVNGTLTVGGIAIGTCPASMAAVGPTCVDVYEASIWDNAACDGTGMSYTSSTPYPSTFPYNGSFTAGGGELYACSIAGVFPAKASWFQANAACTLSGKRLCTNTEWQAAVAGTLDPGPVPGPTQCNMAAGATLALTGAATSCVSNYGSYDMIGNLPEWVADWIPGGLGWISSEGGGGATNAWSGCLDAASYGEDVTEGVNGSSYVGIDPGPVPNWDPGVPAAGARGGGAGGVGSGAFWVDWSTSPCYTGYGFRCCTDRI